MITRMKENIKEFCQNFKTLNTLTYLTWSDLCNRNSKTKINNLFSWEFTQSLVTDNTQIRKKTATIEINYIGFMSCDSSGAGLMKCYLFKQFGTPLFNMYEHFTRLWRRYPLINNQRNSSMLFKNRIQASAHPFPTKYKMMNFPEWIFIDNSNLSY